MTDQVQSTYSKCIHGSSERLRLLVFEMFRIVDGNKEDNCK